MSGPSGIELETSESEPVRQEARHVRPTEKDKPLQDARPASILGREESASFFGTIDLEQDYHRNKKVRWQNGGCPDAVGYGSGEEGEEFKYQRSVQFQQTGEKEREKVSVCQLAPQERGAQAAEECRRIPETAEAQPVIDRARCWGTLKGGKCEILISKSETMSECHKSKFPKLCGPLFSAIVFEPDRVHIPAPIFLPMLLHGRNM